LIRGIEICGYLLKTKIESGRSWKLTPLGQQCATGVAAAAITKNELDRTTPNCKKQTYSEDHDWTSGGSNRLQVVECEYLTKLLMKI
jgi:hypothetical protein